MVHLLRLVLTFTAILLLSSDRVESRVVSGSIDTKSDTVFIDGFAFIDDDAGLLKYDIKYRKIHHFYRLVIYDDVPDQWPYVRANEDKLTCTEKQDVAVRGGRPVETLSPHSNGGCKEEREDGIPVIHCQGSMYWKDYNLKQWWFITVQNCGTYPEEGLRMTYTFTMKNGETSYFRHLSGDERNIMVTDVFAMGLFLFVSVFAISTRSILKEGRLLHLTFRLFLCSFTLQLLALISFTTYLGIYARDGVTKWRYLEITGHVLSSVGTLVFILFVILLPKGYTITRYRVSISTPGFIKIAIFTTVYSFAYGVLYFFKEEMADPRDVMYSYITPVDYRLIALRCLATAWLYYSVGITLKHIPEKKTFYFVYSIIFTLWLISEPVLTLLTTCCSKPYDRTWEVNLWHWIIACIGHLFFIFLTPRFHPRAFDPRDNQVGSLDIGDVELNQPSMAHRYLSNEEFSHMSTVATPETTHVVPVSEPEETPEPAAELITTQSNEDNTITTPPVTSFWILSNDDDDDDELASEGTPEPAAELITTQSNEDNTITTTPVTSIWILSNGDHDDHDDHSTHYNIPSNTGPAGNRYTMVNIPLEED